MNQGVLTGVGNVTNSGTLPIGTQAVMMDVGQIVTMADSSVWLRSGAYVTPAYSPQLAAIKNYRVAGTQSTTPIPTAIVVVQVASDGAGTLVAGTTAGNTMYRSTDSGANWSLVAPGMLGAGGQFSGVAYGGGRFVAVAWYPAGSAAYLVYSTTGVTWTLGATVPYYAGFNGYPRLVYANGQFVGVASATSSVTTTVGCLTFYSVNGTACTTYNSGTSGNGSLNASAAAGNEMLIQGNSSVVVVYPSSSTGGGGACPWGYSLDNGVTWSTTTPNAQSGYYIGVGVNGSAVCTSINGSLTTWASMSAPATFTSQPFASVFGYNTVYNSSPFGFFTTGTGASSKTFVITTSNNVFQMSNDLKSIAPNSNVQLLNANNSPYYYYIPISTGDYAVCQYTTNNITTVYDANLAVFNNVGLKSSASIGNTVYNGQTYYVRIK